MKKFITAILNFIREFFSAYNVDDTPDIIQDLYQPVNMQREAAALKNFRKEVDHIVETRNVSKRVAVCKLMVLDDVDYKDRAEVEKFFWAKGVSQENIQLLTDDFYRLQRETFGGT